MDLYEPSLLVGEARSLYFETSGFGDDGGYSDERVDLKFGPFTFSIPNSPARIRSVKLHDLHHIATGYKTDLVGESEIAAWEVAIGCEDHYAAWVLNLLAMSYSLVLCPRRVTRAFLRGHGAQNLYGREFGEDLLQQTVSELRENLQVSPVQPAITLTGLAAFVRWESLAILMGLTLVAVVLSPLAVVLALFS